MLNNLVQSTNQADTVPLVINTTTQEIGKGVSAINDKLEFRLKVMQKDYDPLVIAGLPVIFGQHTPYNAVNNQLFLNTATATQKHIENKLGFTKIRFDSIKATILTPNQLGGEESDLTFTLNYNVGGLDNYVGDNYVPYAPVDPTPDYIDKELLTSPVIFDLPTIPNDTSVLYVYTGGQYISVVIDYKIQATYLP
jgi:hypothetical protein